MQRDLDTATVSSKTLSVLRGQLTPHTESKKPVYKRPQGTVGSWSQAVIPMAKLEGKFWAE